MTGTSGFVVSIIGSEALPPMVKKVNIFEETSRSRSCTGKKINGKVPKRFHKAEREKMKRDHLNELFFYLANALELCQQTNAKASILCEATRLLKDLLGQIESLKKENASLLSKSVCVAGEKIELKEENSALETELEKLQGEIEARVAQDLHSSEQGPSFLVVPFSPHLQATFSSPDIAELTPKPTCIVSKPHARYPTPADSWPLLLLGEQPTSSEKIVEQEEF